LDADRHNKSLNHLTPVGSLFGSESLLVQPVSRCDEEANDCAGDFFGWVEALSVVPIREGSAEKFVAIQNVADDYESIACTKSDSEPLFGADSQAGFARVNFREGEQRPKGTFGHFATIHHLPGAVAGSPGAGIKSKSAVQSQRPDHSAA
jgi:hypothetical protein